MEKIIGPGSEVVTNDGRKGVVFSISGNGDDSEAVVRFELDKPDFLHRSSSKIQHIKVGELRLAT